MRILFLTPRLPYPPHKGDKLRAYHQIRHLSQRHALTLVSFVERKDERSFLPKLTKYCQRVETVLLRPFQSYLNAVLKAPFSRLPLQVLYYQSAGMQGEISAIIKKGEFDVAHVQLIRMAPYLAPLTELPRVIDFIDALSLNTERRYQRDRSVLKPVIYAEWRRVKGYEAEIRRKYEQVIVVSSTDKEALGAHESVHVNPNGVDMEAFPFVLEGREPHSLIFTGNMGYFPNVDAVLYFYQEIFPLIKRQIPQVKFYIVGARPVREVRNLRAEEGVIVTGLVDSVHEYLRKAAIAVCPMRSGSGIQNKVLEAMSSGIPVVATECALSGIQAIPGEHIVVANEPVEFANCVVELLKSPQLRQKLAANARRLVEQKYTWDLSVRQLERIYEAAIAKHSVAS